MLSPRQTFEDNIRPAELLLGLYRLLDTDDNIVTDGDMVVALRTLVNASKNEDLMLIYNEIFLGLVRQRAQMPKSTLFRGTLAHLLRQSVVISCTALETFLPALLRIHLSRMIQAVGSDFVPANDQSVVEYFQDLNFSLTETLTVRLLEGSSAADYVSNKILGMTGFKYLSKSSGVHVVSKLLGLAKPWDQIAEHLQRDKKELVKTLNDTVERRNDIVHRGDRSREDPTGDPQIINYAWTQQSVDTIAHICLALDALVAERIKEYQALIEANAQHG